MDVLGTKDMNSWTACRDASYECVAYVRVNIRGVINDEVSISLNMELEGSSKYVAIGC